MMVNGLNELDILERPIHCTDTKRKTLYVKEADIWEKDDELNKILQGIKGIALKQRTMINKWQDVNICLLYTSPSPRDRTRSRMPSSA